MKCPYCQDEDTDVIDTRPANDTVRRRRECTACSKRFTTYERTELLDLSVIKKDGARELFDRNKMLRGILKACEKRPIKAERLQQMADEIELALRNQDKTEIPSKKIGELVMEKLREIDEVAYVRFASVYRRFRDARQFAEEVTRLKNANALRTAGAASVK